MSLSGLERKNIHKNQHDVLVDRCTWLFNQVDFLNSSTLFTFLQSTYFANLRITLHILNITISDSEPLKQDQRDALQRLFLQLEKKCANYQDVPLISLVYTKLQSLFRYFPKLKEDLLVSNVISADFLDNLDRNKVVIPTYASRLFAGTSKNSVQIPRDLIVRVCDALLQAEATNPDFDEEMQEAFDQFFFQSRTAAKIFSEFFLTELFGCISDDGMKAIVSIIGLRKQYELLVAIGFSCKQRKEIRDTIQKVLLKSTINSSENRLATFSVPILFSHNNWYLCTAADDVFEDGLANGAIITLVITESNRSISIPFKMVGKVTGLLLDDVVFSDVFLPAGTFLAPTLPLRTTLMNAFVQGKNEIGLSVHDFSNSMELIYMRHVALASNSKRFVDFQKNYARYTPMEVVDRKDYLQQEIEEYP